jgi:phospholipid/cholesterol/gamma-HCH transport system substrate-binding protein
MKRRDEVTVGILLTVAVIILITGTLWLVRGGLKRGYPLFVSFAWGHSVKQGQSVVLSGVTVGYVANVRLNANGLLDVDLIVRNEYQIPKTAIAEVFPVGIFGDVIVALKVDKPGDSFFARGDTIPSRLSSGSGLDALQKKADSIATALARITQTLETELVAAGGIRDLRQAIGGMNRLVTQIQSVVAEQDKNVTATLATVRSAVDSADIGRTMRQVRTTAASADSLALRLSSNTTQLQAILARLERGEGTAGKLLADSMLYTDARALIVRADSLLADIKKNPGRYVKLSIW